MTPKPPSQHFRRVACPSSAECVRLRHNAIAAGMLEKDVYRRVHFPTTLEVIALQQTIPQRPE